MKRFASLTLLYIFLLGAARAQVAYDFNLLVGKVVKNYPRFPDSKAAILARFSYNKKLTGGSPWHQYYSYPEWTVQANYGSLGNKEELGNISGLSTGLRFTKELDDRWAVGVNATFGIAYFNQPFDEVSNPDNVAIGASFTPLATADAGFYYHINPYWSAFSMLSILHCSNAHTHLPNLGINLPAISFGIRYRPTPAILTQQKTESTVTDKKPKLNFRLALGLHEMGSSEGPVDGPEFPVYLASIYIYRHYNPVSRWQMGIDAYYDSGVYSYITSQRYYDTNEKLKSMSVVYMIGNEFIFGHLSLVTQGGIYLYHPFAHDLYEESDGDVKGFLKQYVAGRLGFQYYLKNTFLQKHQNLFLGWYVKTNLGQADFMEMSLGYNF